MCARRFLIMVFVLTLLVVAAGFAFYQWGGNVLLRQATPKGQSPDAPRHSRGMSGMGFAPPGSPGALPTQ